MSLWFEVFVLYLSQRKDRENGELGGFSFGDSEVGGEKITVVSG